MRFRGAIHLPPLRVHEPGFVFLNSAYSHDRMLRLDPFGLALSKHFHSLFLSLLHAIVYTKLDLNFRRNHKVTAIFLPNFRGILKDVGSASKRMNFV